MDYSRKIAMIMVMALFIIALDIGAAYAQPSPLTASEGAILIDLNNKQVLFEKDADIKMYPASTTKIMTAMLAIKKGKLDDMVTVSRQACLAGGSAVGLQEDEKLPLGELLYALLLPSANDAAVAIAEHIGQGSLDNFIVMMNQQAQSLGAKNTNFANPHGMPDENHYTTARDMSIIASWAMSDPTFRNIVSKYHHRTERVLPRPVNGIPQVDFVTTNRLLWNPSRYSYPGTTGVKTGFTSEAGHCLVYSVERDNRVILGVLLKSQSFDTLYGDARIMADYGFTGFKQVQVARAGQEIARINLEKGKALEVAALAKADFYYNVPIDSKAEAEKEIQLIGEITAPVARGDILGKAVFTLEGQPVGQVDLVAAQDVKRKTAYWLWGILSVLGLLLAIRVINKIRYSNRRRKYRSRSYYL